MRAEPKNTTVSCTRSFLNRYSGWRYSARMRSGRASSLSKNPSRSWTRTPRGSPTARSATDLPARVRTGLPSSLLEEMMKRPERVDRGEDAEHALAIADDRRAELALHH